MEHARKNMVIIDLYKDTIYHPITTKYGSTKVIILPASEGTGIIAGSAMRAIFEVSGIKNIVAKCIGSTNPINVVRATIKALIHIMSPDIISEKRNIPLNKIMEMKKC
jgi:small subunit ribosomal protein S5